MTESKPEVTVPPARPITGPRFPLFGKIVLGFAIIIFFTILSSIFLLYQMNDVFSEGETESQNLQLGQYLQKLFTLENESASKFFETRDSNATRNFFRISGHFKTSCDSLLRVNNREEN